jgi:hypothetical protein
MWVPSLRTHCHRTNLWFKFKFNCSNYVWPPDFPPGADQLFFKLSLESEQPLATRSSLALGRTPRSNVRHLRINSAAESVHGRLRFQKEILQAAQTERLQRAWFIILRAACTETLFLGWKCTNSISVAP